LIGQKNCLEKILELIYSSIMEKKLTELKKNFKVTAKEGHKTKELKKQIYD